MPKYIITLEDDNKQLSTIIKEAQTHSLACKLATREYPDLKVVKILQRWIPIAECARCGSPIFKGDYQKDKIRQRYGKNRCLDCP